MCNTLFLYKVNTVESKGCEGCKCFFISICMLLSQLRSWSVSTVFFPVDPNKDRREAVKRKTTQYLKRAEEIFISHLQDNLGKGSSHLGVRQWFIFSLYWGHLDCAFVQSDLKPFIHTFTHQRRCQPHTWQPARREQLGLDVFLTSTSTRGWGGIKLATF